VTPDVIVEVSIRDGAELARRTWNPRLGIVGGLSVLGTTGVVVPYSCSAWIDSIRRGVDVARATGCRHVGAATGSTSEATVRALYGLAPEAMLDMGDFAGAVLRYLRRHPLPHLTIGGGIGKMVKLGDGHLDLHSGRSQVDLPALAAAVERAGGGPGPADAVRGANTALDALRLSEAHGFDLGGLVARRAFDMAASVLAGSPVRVDTVVIDRAGRIVGRAGSPPSEG
jgi:cobalt-precorrin-5B (C1)-methyltransferase